MRLALALAAVTLIGCTHAEERPDAAVAAIPPPIEKPVLMGNVTGADGKPVALAHVHVGKKAYPVNADGSFRIEPEEKGFTQVRFSGVNHGETTAVVWLEDRATRVNVQLGTHPREEALSKVGLIVEAFVPFERELSGVAVRGRDGEFRTWPLTENWHVAGVLSASLAPARADDSVARTAIDYARRLAERTDYVGVFALELFYRDGQLLANEMAPRVHNSGHWTIEGAETSQFQNHLRAVLGLPLGDTRMLGHACMLNWIGQMPDALALLGEAGGHWHDYGKLPRAGRKVGHATVRADDVAELAQALERAGRALGREAQVAPVIERLRG